MLRSIREKAFFQASCIIGERLIFLIPQATTILLVTRLRGSEFFGKYALVLTWAAVFQLVANFGLTECLSREVGREPGQASRYLRHGLVVSTVFALASAGIMMAADWLVHYPEDVAIAILIAGAFLLPTNITGTCRGVLLATKRIEYMLGIGMIEGLVVIPLTVYWILSGAGLLPLIGAILLSKLTAATVVLVAVHNLVAPVTGPLRYTLLRTLSITTLPFGLNSLLLFPAIRFDVFLLSKMASFETVGLYSAASKLMEFLLVLPGTFYIAMLPRTAEDFTATSERKTERLQRAVAGYLSLVIPVGVGIIGFAQPLLLLVYGTEFTGAALLLQILMVAFLLFGADAIFALMCKAAGFQGVDLTFTVISTALNLVLNILLIPSLAAVGSGLALVLSILVGLILRWHFATRSIARIDWLILVRSPLLVSVSLISVCVLLQGWIPWPIRAISYAVGYSAFTLLPRASGAIRRNPASR